MTWPLAAFLSFPKLKMKLIGHHFDTIEENEAELQAVLSTLADHEFQDAFKKRQNHWEQCTRAEGDSMRCDDGQ
jgi:hypothetical protein